MNKKIASLTALLLILLMLTSCGAVMGTPAPTNTAAQPIDSQATIDQAVAQTLVAETQIALSIAQTLEALHSSTPLPSPTASQTPSPSSTAVPSPTTAPVFPTLTVSAETNCRSGPGRSFDLLATLQAGDTAEVVMRTTAANYWLIRNPDNPLQFCWLWGQYATLVGDWASLPAATPPHTPTPPPALQIKYLGMMLCGDYVVRFEIKNLSQATYESLRLTITDTSTTTSVIYTTQKFKDYTACVLVNTLNDLEPEEVGVVVNEAPADFGYNPGGHVFKAVFTLYTTDGFSGDSETAEITFVP